MRRLVFLIILIFHGCSSTHPCRLAICAIFKNEAPWLKEWIVYHHHILGVERFYLYNNESTDNYSRVLDPFIEKGIVELIDWDSNNPMHQATGAFMDAPWSAAQLGAYNDCLKNRALGQAKWVAMIDIDEFITPSCGVKAFYQLLNKAQKDQKGTVALHWKMFGTSNVKSLGQDDLLIEKLTFRAQDDYHLHHHVKSIHRPEAIDFCLVHIADKLKPPFGSRTLKPDLVSIHHYWARTEEFCLQKRKVSKVDELNQIKDETMLPYVDEVKKFAF